MSCCPTLILVLNGPCLSILGTILTDKWVVQRLSSTEYLGETSTLPKNDQLRISRVLYALRLAIEELGSWYSTLASTPSNRIAASSLNPPPILLPSTNPKAPFGFDTCAHFTMTTDAPHFWPKPLMRMKRISSSSSWGITVWMCTNS